MARKNISTMTGNTNIEYVTTCFEFPTFTTIIGNPGYESLQKIKNELRTNASSVQCDLSGGANGHLGLVLTTEEYVFVALNPYVKPVHLGALIIPPGPANYQTTVLREDHNEDIRVFKEALNVEKALNYISKNLGIGLQIQ